MQNSLAKHLEPQPHGELPSHRNLLRHLQAKAYVLIPMAAILHIGLYMISSSKVPAVVNCRGFGDLGDHAIQDLGHLCL